MTALLGLLMSKAGVYLALALALVGVLFGVRRSGVQAEQAAELRRGAADRRTADAVTAEVGKLTGDQARAELDRDARP